MRRDIIVLSTFLQKVTLFNLDIHIYIYIDTFLLRGIGVYLCLTKNKNRLVVFPRIFRSLY